MPARHHVVVRVTHWVNVVALTIMVASGLRIFNAHPAFARIGEKFCCYPFEGKPIPAWLTFGGWLAGARNWHFAMMWLLVLNGLVYLGFIWLHGEWRDLVPRRSDPRDAWEMVKFYLFLRRHHPRQGKHNTLQKLAYFSMPLVAILAVLSGIAIWKPVQLGWLTSVFGGFAFARYVHFLAMLVIVVLALGHVFMVLSVDPYSLRSILTGGYDASLSPEARDGRPFYHLFRRPRAAMEVTTQPSAPAAQPAPEPGREPGAPALAEGRGGVAADEPGTDEPGSGPDTAVAAPTKTASPPSPADDVASAAPPKEE